jgi:hypothetical protein
MKPIEEGCKAVIVNSAAGNDGIVVTVGKFIGDKKEWVYGSHWEIDKTITSRRGQRINFIAEAQLRRIDDEDTTTWEHVAETIGFIPNKRLVEQE